MRDYLNIGSVPYSEDCAQVGTDDYQRLSRIECRTFAAQIRRVCGEPPTFASIGVKSFPHDFGSYSEVVIYFNDEDKEATDYAFMVEGSDLEYWDTESKLAILGAMNKLEA